MSRNLEFLHILTFLILRKTPNSLLNVFTEIYENVDDHQSIHYTRNNGRVFYMQINLHNFRFNRPQI